MPSVMGRLGWRDTAGTKVPSMIWRGIGISVATSLVLLLAPGVASASTPTPSRFQGATHSVRNGTTTDVIALDKQTCTKLGAGAGCTVTVSTTVATTAAPTTTGGGATLAAMSGSGCVTVVAQLNYGWMGISFMVDEIDVNMCWNGVISWKNGAAGPDCKLYPPPGYSFTMDWCGMYNDNTSRTQAGDNWHISTIWSTTYYWARLNFRGAGLFGISYYWTGG